MAFERGDKTQWSNAELGYAVLRLGLGLNIFMHGVSRLISGPGVFTAGLHKQFQSTLMPAWSIQAFGMSLPFLETAIGLFVLVGLFTRPALVAGGLLMAVLTFGVTLVQQWDIAGIQLIYIGAFAALLLLLAHNSLSLDGLLSKRRFPRPGVIAALLGLALAASFLRPEPVEAGTSAPKLVELFTSEGCSSCPPADALLTQLTKDHGRVIALSEHVSYWNSLGWKDPFSSDESTQRQEDYARRFGGEGPYTPQMVVNGTTQFVGNDQRSALAALDVPASLVSPSLTVTQTADKSAGKMAVTVKFGGAPQIGRLIAVLVQNQGRSAVLRGENGGRTLSHVDIAREFHALSQIKAGQSFEGETKFALPADAQSSGFHVVAFFQTGPGGPVLAAASSEDVAPARN